MAFMRVEKNVALSADQAFAIAADVASYKDFVPMVKRSTIRGEVLREGAIAKFAADLAVAFERMNINESFTSFVVTDADAKTVSATSDHGPVKALQAVWKIVALSPSQSNISVEIDYQFKNMMMQIAAGGFMKIGAQRILEAFEQRGQKLYPSTSV